MSLTQPSQETVEPADTPSGPRGGVVVRALRALYAHPRRALVATFIVIVTAGAIGAPGTGALESEGGLIPPEADSVQAIEQITAETGVEPSPGIVLLVETPSADDTAAVQAAAETLAGIDGVAGATPAQAATDGTSALAVGALNGEADSSAVAENVLEQFADDPDITVGGGAVADLQLNNKISEDLTRAELIAFPILVILALLFFRGRAAVLPVTVGLATVLGTFLTLTGINQIYGINSFALNLVIGLGLGLAIDYTLFLVTRYREELDRQGPTFAAVMTTMRTAGRTVVFSAATVAVALATLAIFPMGFLTSMGVFGVVVAVIAATTALVISPIMFGLWGSKLARRRGKGDGRWYRVSHVVMRRPGMFAIVTAAVMIGLASPALRTVWTPVDETVVPESQSARTVTDAIASDYADTGTTPVTIVVSSNGTGDTEGDDTADIAADFAQQASSMTEVAAPAEPIALNGGSWQIDLEVAGDPAGEDARAVVMDVRELIDDNGIDALVAGPAAEFIDQQGAIADNLPLAIALLVLLTMLVLWLMTGSVVLPIINVIMNVLTVGVSLGAVTWVYQDGRLTDLLRYTPNGGVEPTDFVIAAAVVFALSTDYGVFLLGRIKEARESGLTERESIAVGLGRTGSVVTAAAILLAVAIGVFSLSEISFIQQIGVAVAIGVMVDAFIVRSLLVPGLMGLMGKWNWWAPMPLRRLHDKVGMSESGSDLPPSTASEPAEQHLEARAPQHSR